jgi:hypothetical protein
VLTGSAGRKATPNRELYGDGYDAYLYAQNPAALNEEFQKRACGLRGRWA